jgi:hypothetical protein
MCSSDTIPAAKVSVDALPSRCMIPVIGNIVCKLLHGGKVTLNQVEP